MKLACFTRIHKISIICIFFLPPLLQTKPSSRTLDYITGLLRGGFIIILSFFLSLAPSIILFIKLFHLVHKHSQGYFTLKNKIPHIFCLPVELPFYHSASFIGELEKNHTFLHLYSHSHIQSLLIYHRPKYSSKIIFFSH